MFTASDIRVKLVNSEEVKEFVKRHGEFASICYNTPKSKGESVGKLVLNDGHFSGSRADFFKFEIKLVPRYTVDQAVRHEQGIVKNVQSQRYVDMANFNIYMTDLVANDEYLRNEMIVHEKTTQERYKRMKEYLAIQYGIVGEEANDNIRAILPIGCESQFNFALNLEGLIHFMHVRLCKRADAPIRELAKQMRAEVLKVAPIYKEYLVPKCQYNLFCNEKHGCRDKAGNKIYPTRQELIEKINTIR